MLRILALILLLSCKPTVDYPYKITITNDKVAKYTNAFKVTNGFITFQASNGIVYAVPMCSIKTIEHRP